MRRCGVHLVALVCLGVLVLANTAAADNIFQKGAHSCARDWARCNHWPEPFIYPDRDAVVAPFGVMIAKGWQVQNTLSDHHFQQGTSQLADAGLLKVQQILTETDPHRRTIFVQTALTPTQTMARMAEVRTAVSQMLPGVEPAVYPTSINVHAWPADAAGRVFSSFNAQQPPVKLPAPRKDGGSSN